jgi:HK97 family phage major capsid protein
MPQHMQTLIVRKRDAKQITAVLASEYPVQRTYGSETLRITRDAINFERFPLPVITQHDLGNLPVGVATNPRIIGRELVADILMGDSNDAERVYGDIKLGVINNLSIGYSIDDAEEDADGNRVITRFTPHEVSFVSVPADPRATVIQRSKEMNEQTTRSERISEKKSLSQEHRLLIDLGKRYQCMDEALDCIDQGISPKAFRAELIKREQEEMAASAVFVKPTQETRSDDRFSLSKAILGMATNDWSGAEHERELMHANRNFATQNGSFVISPKHMQRDILKSGSGDNIVPDIYHADRFIDRLITLSNVTPEITMIPGLSGDAVIPRMTAGTSAAFFAEGDPVTESTPAFDQIVLSGNTLAGYVQFSRKMLVNASPNVEQIVRQDLARAVADKIEETILTGSGSGNVPVGILNKNGINAVAIGDNGGAPTFSKLMEMIAEVRTDNIEGGKFVMHSKTAANLRTRVRFTNDGHPILTDDNTIGGAQVVISNHMPIDGTKGNGTDLHSIIYGDLTQYVMAQFGGIEIVVDPHTNMKNGLINVGIFVELDADVRHLGAFCAMTDVDIAA